MKTNFLTILILLLCAIGCTTPPPVAIQLAWPQADEAVDANPILQWQPVDGAAQYSVTVTALGSDTAVFTQETTASNIQVAPALLPGSYSWHVQAFDNDGSVTAELTSTFSVKDAITLRYPPTEEAVDPSPILQWESFPDTVSYHVVVLDDVAYPPQVVIDQTVTEPMLAVDPPLAPGHYSWTVWAQDGDTAVLAELTSTFSVKDVVELVAPAAGETVSPEPLLQWQGFPGAVSYQVIVIDDAAYPPVVVLDQITSETSLAVSPLLEPGSYSWSVWAFDGSDKLLAELTSSFVVAEE